MAAFRRLAVFENELPQNLNANIANGQISRISLGFFIRYIRFFAAQSAPWVFALKAGVLLISHEAF
jgi:hypothetical protein